MKIEQAASHLALAMDNMMKTNGILSVSNHSGLESGNVVHVTAEFFKDNFQISEMIDRKDTECPIEIRANLNGITFLAILSNSERDELFPNTR